MRSRSFIPIAIATCALGAAPAHAADRLITRDPTAANVTAHGGSANVVWARVGSDGRSRLVHRIRKTPRTCWTVCVRPCNSSRKTTQLRS